MKKKSFLVLMVVSVIILGVLAVAAQESSPGQEISERARNLSNENKISADVSKYVEKFAEKRGVSPEEINNISEIDFNNLPKNVNIKNVTDANLAIYGVNYSDKKEIDPKKKDKELFVITYSKDKLENQGDLIVSHDKRMFLNFGSEGEMFNEGFLKTATGVEGSLEAGYVMTREGSITGVSTNLEVVNSSEGNIEVVVYKNGEPISFGNTIESDSSGVKKDHDVQSKGVVEFKSGDVISAKARADSDSSWKNVITMVEVTTSN